MKAVRTLLFIPLTSISMQGEKPSTAISFTKEQNSSDYGCSPTESLIVDMAIKEQHCSLRSSADLVANRAIEWLYAIQAKKKKSISDPSIINDINELLQEQKSITRKQSAESFTEGDRMLSLKLAFLDHVAHLALFIHKVEAVGFASNPE